MRTVWEIKEEICEVRDKQTAAIRKKRRCEERLDELYDELEEAEEEKR